MATALNYTIIYLSPSAQGPLTILRRSSNQWAVLAPCPHPPSCCWTVLTCDRPMDGEARQPARATLPEIWSPTCLPHEQLRLQAHGWRARLGKNWVSREPMKATLCLRRGEKQLATGTQVYTSPGQGERKGERGADRTGRRKPYGQNYLHFITGV